MVFSSPLFLFLFLPVVLGLHLLFRGVLARNLLLLLVSIVFYAWGEVYFVWLILASTLVNYLFGLWMHQHQGNPRSKFILALAISLNLSVLVFFKYANFLVENLNLVLADFRLEPFHLRPVHLPIGISFFTFHALSYVVDIYRRERQADQNPINVALYIFFFPQLIAGPIIRYGFIAKEIVQRTVSLEGFAEGIRRFVLGLAKKVLIANVLAVPVDAIFKLPASEVTSGLAWLAAICYTLQIYFDFSGYSDMAIGLGRMFGFHFPENFNYPYIARSLKDFWARWHISLSTWFRDYLYIPLGGNRGSAMRTGFNLLTVFLLCGLWHGASWAFVVWGLFHGVFLVLERTRFGSWLRKLPVPVQHGYTLLVVVISWMFFRAETFSGALTFLAAMGGAGAAVPGKPLALYVNHHLLTALVAGVIFALPVWKWLHQIKLRLTAPEASRVAMAAQRAGAFAEPLVLLVLLVLSAAALAAGTYNPFIYFRF